MQRVTDTTLLMAQAGSAAGLLVATAWPAMLAGLCWGIAQSWTPVATGGTPDEEGGRRKS